MSTTVHSIKEEDIIHNKIEFSIMIIQIRLLVGHHVHNIKMVEVTRDKCNLTTAVEALWDMVTETTIIKTITSTILKCSTTPSKKITVAVIDLTKEASQTITEATPTFHKLANLITCITFLIFIPKTATIYTVSQKME